eukprot:760715-Hanusia_phi.AAC.1
MAVGDVDRRGEDSEVRGREGRRGARRGASRAEQSRAELFTLHTRRSTSFGYMSTDFASVALGADGIMQQAKKGKDDRGREAGQEEEEEEEEVHKTCMDQVRENRRTIESLLYIVFLILFTIYAMYAHGNTTDAFAFHQQVKNIFSPFLLVTSVDEWWTFMTGPFVNVSFPFRWYNGELLLPDDLGFVNMQFKPLGTINVRQ